MRPTARATLVALLLAGWWGVEAPGLVRDLEARRARERVEPQILPLASAIAEARRSLLPRGAEAARARDLLQEAAFDLQIERSWTNRAGSALNPSQRADLAPAPERPRARHQPWLDPELPALLDALGQSHGWKAVNPPDEPPFDPWPGVEPRRRAEVLRVLAPELSDEAAWAVEGLALEAARAAGRRAAAEEALRALLDPAVVRAAAALPGDPAHLDSALEILRLRAG